MTDFSDAELIAFIEQLENEYGAADFHSMRTTAVGNGIQRSTKRAREENDD